MEDKKVPRREFLARLAAGLVVGGLPSCAPVLTYQAHLENGRILLDLKEIEELIQPGKALLIKVPEWSETLILFQDDNGFFKALSSRCTHLGCQVRPARNFLTCPCHGSTFDLQGGVVRGPAQKPLPRFPVEVRGQQIEVVVS